jgi:hypothetical protein
VEVGIGSLRPFSLQPRESSRCAVAQRRSSINAASLRPARMRGRSAMKLTVCAVVLAVRGLSHPPWRPMNTKCSRHKT